MEDLPDTPILTLGEQGERPLTAVLEIEGILVPMEVDTGRSGVFDFQSNTEKAIPQGEVAETQGTSKHIHCRSDPSGRSVED